jgi:hypothetical protein
LLKYFLMTVFLITSPAAEAGIWRDWFAHKCEYWLKAGVRDRETLVHFNAVNARLRGIHFNSSLIPNPVAIEEFFPTVQLTDKKGPASFSGDIMIRVAEGHLYFYQIINESSRHLPYLGEVDARFIVSRETYYDEYGVSWSADLVRFLGFNDVEYYFYFLRTGDTVVVQAHKAFGPTVMMFKLYSSVSRLPAESRAN